MLRHVDENFIYLIDEANKRVTITARNNRASYATMEVGDPKFSGGYFTQEEFDRLVSEAKGV